MRTVHEGRTAFLCVALLHSKSEPLTIGDMARKCRCSRDAVKRSLYQLVKEGNDVRVVSKREGKRGPESAAFYIEDGLG